MDVLISIVLGVAVLVVLAVLVLTSLGVGDKFLDPVVGYWLGPSSGYPAG